MRFDIRWSWCAWALLIAAACLTMGQSCGGPAPAACVDGAQQIKTVWLPASQHVAVQASASSILFDPLHGTSTPAGTARVTGRQGAIHHVVNIMGRVRSCSPEGLLPGHRPC